MTQETQKGLGPVLSLVPNEIVEVDGKHPAVRGTSFLDENIRLRVKRLTRSQHTKIQERHVVQKKGAYERFDTNGYMLEIFNECLVGWNFRQANGEPLPFNEKTKAEAAEYSSELVGIVVGVATRIDLAALAAGQAETEEALKGN